MSRSKKWEARRPEHRMGTRVTRRVRLVELDESQWSAWIDAWIDAAYEQASVRLHPLDFESLTDWCTCGDSRADHYGSRSHCVHEHCDCRRFKRSAREKRPTPRRTVQTWSKGIDPRLAV